MHKIADDFLRTYPYLFDGQYSLENIQPALVSQYKASINQNSIDFIRIWDEGIIHATKLEWDTKFFGFGMGAIEHIFFTEQKSMSIHYNELMEWVTFHGIKYLSARVNINNNASINLLLKDDFELITGKVMMRVELAKVDLSVSNNALTFQQGVDPNSISTLLRIAENSFIENRFYKDTYLNRSKSSELYRQWLYNALNSDPTRIYTASIDGAALGFCLVNRNVIDSTGVFGFISLIAVDSKHNGRGIAQALLRFVLKEFSMNDISIVYANVVNSNFQSLNTFQSVGFRFFSQLVEARKIIK
jgi:ribosomal protein S18 acetylase RimI-like enzyme